MELPENLTCEVTILYGGRDAMPVLLFNTSAESSYVYIWHISYHLMCL
jgi:hypothetical protein